MYKDLLIVSTGFDGISVDKRQNGDKILFSYIGYKNSVVVYWSKITKCFIRRRCS
jgi:hypothetical protein